MLCVCIYTQLMYIIRKDDMLCILKVLLFHSVNRRTLFVQKILSINPPVQCLSNKTLFVNIYT